MKILAVDDEFVSRKKAQKMLLKYGECDTAVDGYEALEAFHLAFDEGEPYDLVFMDIEMENLSGIETLKKIRTWEDSKNVPHVRRVKVIMLSATESASSVMSSFKEGCQSFIVKPLNAEKLIKALKETGLSD